MGPYDSMFDRNHDGELDINERVDMYEFYDRMEGKGIYENSSESDFESDIEEAGLDIDELEMMDEDERAEALEDAGLDPDDWD